MDPLETIAGLAARARAERPPEVDVAAGVLRALRSGGGEPEVKDRWLAWAAGAAAAAAVPALVLGVQLYQLLSDPLVTYVYRLDWVLL